MTMNERALPVMNLPRLAWAFATLAGVGASIGLGLCAVQLGNQLPDFAATNHLSMLTRGILLKWLFFPMLVLPALVSTYAFLRVNDPNRLRTLERLASRFAPLTAFGLWPLLLHDGLWKGRTLLFLVSTLVSTLLVWGSLRNLTLFAIPGDMRAMLRVIRQTIPARWITGSPLVLLVLVIVAILVRGLNDTELASVRTLRGDPAVTLASSLHQLGHGGLLGVPLVLLPKLRAPSALNTFVFLGLVTGAALPLYVWAKSRLGAVAALVVSLLYLAFPSLLTAGVKSALPLGAAAFFFFVAAHGWEKQRYVIASVATLLTLAVHEQTAFWFVCLFVYFAQKRPSLRLFPWLVVAPLTHFAFVAGLLLPAYGVKTYADRFHGLWSANTPGMLPALGTLFANPVHALMRFSEQREPMFLLLVCVPFALVPLRNKCWLLWGLPFFWFGVVALGHFPDATLTHFSVAHFIVMGYIAAVTALESIRRGERGRERLWATLFTWCFALIPCAYQLGCAWLAPL